MKRSTTQFLAIVASVTCPIMAGADEYKIRALEARLEAFERRLSSIEGGRPSAEPKMPKKHVPAQSTFVYDEAAKPLKTEFSVPKNETYVIRDGDSLGGIARKLDIPRGALLKANNLEDGQPIYIGETLIIPRASKPAIDGGAINRADSFVHTVKPGESLSGIARRYNLVATDIKQANRLHTDSVGQGQQLIIPGSAVGPTGPAMVYDSTTKTQVEMPNSTEPTSGKYSYENPLLDTNETYGYYQVKNGDNLYALARDFFTSPSELQRLNNMGGSTVIHTGQEVVVPTSKYNEYHNNIVGR